MNERQNDGFRRMRIFILSLLLAMALPAFFSSRAYAAEENGNPEESVISTMPDFRGITQAEAEERAAALGLALTVHTRGTGAEEAGIVLEQSIPVGTPLDGQELIILVGVEKPKLTVPEASRDSDNDPYGLADAVRILQDAGFTHIDASSLVIETDTETLVGLVAAQDPAAGTVVYEDETVYLVLYALPGQHPEAETYVPGGREPEESTPEESDTEDTASESESTDESDPSESEESDSSSDTEPASEGEYITVGDYRIPVSNSGAKIPDDFFMAYDIHTFPSAVQCFFNSSYREYVYPAEKDGETGWYVYDRLHETMLPFALLDIGEEKPGIMVATVTESDIPGSFMKYDTVSVKNLVSGETEELPCYVSAAEGEEVKLLQIKGYDSSARYYVMTEEEGAVKAVPFTAYFDKETEESSSEESSSEPETSPSESSSEPVKPSPIPGANFLKNYKLWLGLLLLIILILIIAIIIVFRMSRKQDREEAEIEEKEREARDDHDLLKSRNEIESGYSNTVSKDPDPFDVSFEDSFPEEMEIGKQMDDAFDTGKDTVESFERPAEEAADVPADEAFRRPAAEAVPADEDDDMIVVPLFSEADEIKEEPLQEIADLETEPLFETSGETLNDEASAEKAAVIETETAAGSESEDVSGSEPENAAADDDFEEFDLSDLAETVVPAGAASAVLSEGKPPVRESLAEDAEEAKNAAADVVSEAAEETADSAEVLSEMGAEAVSEAEAEAEEPASDDAAEDIDPWDNYAYRDDAEVEVVDTGSAPVNPVLRNDIFKSDDYYDDDELPMEEIVLKNRSVEKSADDGFSDTDRKTVKSRRTEEQELQDYVNSFLAPPEDDTVPDAEELQDDDFEDIDLQNKKK